MTTTLIERLLRSNDTNWTHERPELVIEAADEIIRLQNEMRGMVPFEKYFETMIECQRLRSDLVQRASEQASTTVRSPTSPDA